MATSLTYARALRLLAEHLGCEPSEEAVFRRRLASEPADYAADLLRATGTAYLLLDDGYPPAGEGFDLATMGELAGCACRPVLRLERVAEEALGRSLPELRDHVRAAVERAPAEGYAALKTIAAYRGGLDLGEPDERAARAELSLHEARERGRLEGRHVLGLLLWDALETNAEAGRLPVQVHVGFGDGDLFLPRADPGYLKPLLERFPETPFVLLHCYPFVREAGWLAHVYANVYLDLSLTIPHVARPAVAVREALELAPASKLLYASDAARAPELYLLASVWWREALAEVLAAELPPDDAARVGRAILHDTALELYRLHGR